jgi:tRNA A-37 threonylcarbamoyl transferase component Bud32
MKHSTPPQFTRLSLDGVKGHFLVRSSFVEEFRRTLEAHPEQYPAALPTEGRGHVHEFLTVNHTALMVRHYVHGGVLGGLTRDLHWGAGRALQELRVSEEARQRHIPTPEILAIRYEPVLGLLCRLDIVTRKVVGARPLDDVVRSIGDTRSIRPLIPRVARFVRTVHDTGLHHPDLHIRNILVAGTEADVAEELVLVDLDRNRFEEPLSPSSAYRSLFRLHRSLEKFGVDERILSERDRIRFLLAYFGADTPGHLDFRRFLRRCRRHTARHRLGWRLFPPSVPKPPHIPAPAE